LLVSRPPAAPASDAQIVSVANRAPMAALQRAGSSTRSA
jgi:hypothetical protein